MNTRNTIRNNNSFNDNNINNNKIICSQKSNKSQKRKQLISDDLVFDNCNKLWTKEKNCSTGKTAFVCKWKLCSYRTISESLILRHLLSHSKPFMCSFNGCGQRFETKDWLLAHFSQTHLDVNAFKCTFGDCQQKFSDIKSLTDHRISHVSKTNKFSKKCESNSAQNLEQIIEDKYLLIKEKLKKQNTASIRLSDCIDNRISYHFVKNDNEDNHNEDINTVRDTDLESEKARNSTKLTTTIELASPQNKSLSNDRNEKINDSHDYLTPIHRVIRCSYDKIRDQIIERNDNFIKLRSTDGKFWYKCLWDYCDYGNINEGLIRRHVEKHEFPHKCSFDGCNKCFATLSQMVEHRDRTHTGDKPHKCDWPLCQQEFQTLEMLSDHRLNHLPKINSSEERHRKSNKTVDSKPFHCSFGRCCMHYATEEELNSHQQIHSGDRPFKCLYPECTFAAKSKDKLQTHHLRHSANKTFRCLWPTCHKRFAISEQLRRHRQTHTKREVLMCEFVDCDLIFESVIELETHLRQHLGSENKDNEISFEEIGFKCNFGFCKQHFQTKNELEEHSRRHRGKRLYKCGYDKCSFSAQTLNKLSAHIRYHSGERPFKCEFIGCHQQFIQSHHLLRHRRTHFGDNNFEIKNKSQINSNKSLNSRKRQSSEIQVKSEELDIEQKSNKRKKSEKSTRLDSNSDFVFSTEDLDFDSNLIVVKKNPKKKVIKRKSTINKSVKKLIRTSAHKESPNDKKLFCSFGKCGFRCKTETELNQHKELHSGDRRFACDYEDCTFRSNRKDHLVIHKRRHTGEKPYSCQWNNCNQAFVNRDHLNRHLLTHNRFGETLQQLNDLDKDIEQTLHELNHIFNENS